jgi:hypothetical protein
VIEVLRPNDPVEVQGEAEEMFEIESKRLLPPVGGYVPKSALAMRIPKVEIFSKIEQNDGTLFDPAPPDLPAVEFEAWLKTQDEPTWLFEDGNLSLLAGDRMRKEFEGYRSAWREWFAEVVKNNRTQTATLDEWYIVLSGGREMWSFRPERIFKEPTERSAGLGWASPGDILRWTGRVRYSEREWKYKLWYEVELTKLGRVIKGWYKAALLEEFVIPEVYVEASDRSGIAGLFDMTRPKVYLPADPEIGEAILAQRNAPQYINVQNATGRNKVNYNLCGQFCAAALCGVDVIPLVQKWYQSSKRGRAVIDGDRGTLIFDLQEMLGLFDVKSETFRPEPSVAPATPGYLEKHLRSGKKAIVGVGLTKNGEAAYNASIRHWLVITDIVRMGNNGWVRVYNSYFNQEEVYPYQRIFNTGIATGIGLWVDAPETKRESRVAQKAKGTQSISPL